MEFSIRSRTCAPCGMSAASAIPHATSPLRLIDTALFEIYITKQASQRIAATRAFLSAGDHPVAVQQHIQRIALGFEERREICVFRQDDLGRARKLIEILLDRLL